MKTEAEEKSLITRSPRALVTQATLAPELGYPEAQAFVAAERWSYSKFKKVIIGILRAKNVLAHTVRVRHKNGTQVEVWLQKGEKKIYIGQGSSFANALDNIFLAPLKAKEEEQAELPVPSPEECLDVPAEDPAR